MPLAQFHQIFDENQRQNDIFDIVAKPVVTSVLQGFNGTIFAYGQTGSGKTFTMTGSTKQYEDRGLIPRSLQYIFIEIEKTEEKPTLCISYMEIYNEICYDLLSPRNNRTAIRLEELPRVTLLENRKGEPSLRNLSVLPVSTEEEAMRLLFLGDTNRAIAETPLNEYSSRSHCIFTVYVSSRLDRSQSMTFSKLNLVDLAGSERVHKSNITGTVLNEAKHINLSLHFLQQVILALSESKRTHIPYRNSLMTLILKDSLAGNCLTVMLANLAVSRRNIQETISTCRFAQRVSLIKTDPVINEVSDPYQEILLLKNEVQELRKQLAIREQDLLVQDSKYLTSKQKEDLERKLETYLDSDEDSSRLDCAPGLMQDCFRFFRNKIKILENKLMVKDNLLSAPPKADNFGKGSPRHNIQGKTDINKEGTKCQQDWNDVQSNPEVDYYVNRLSNTYEKAKLLSAAIEECQVNISYIREKLDFMSIAGDCRKKMILCKELEHQQNIYRDSLLQLKDLKNETLQLEAGLTKAKAKIDHYLIKQRPCDSINVISQNSEMHSELLEETQSRGDNCVGCLEAKQNLRISELHLQTECLDNCWGCLHGGSRRHTSVLTKQKLYEAYEDAHKCCCYPNYRKVVKADLPNIINNVITNYGAHDSRICCPDYFKSGSLLPSIYGPTNHIRSASDTGGNTGDFRGNAHPCCDGVPRFIRSDNPRAINNVYNMSENSCENCVCTQCASIPATKVPKSPNLIIKETLGNSGNKPGSGLFVTETCCTNLVTDSEVQLIPDKLSKPQFPCQTFSNQPSPACQEEVLNSDTSDDNGICNIDSNMPIECSTSKPLDNKYDIFEETDTEEFRKFVSTLTLTGDEAVDREICDFYRAKLCP